MAAEIIENDPGEGPVASTPLGMRTRPWHVFSGELESRLDEMGDTDAWTMNATEAAETAVELQRIQARLTAVQARVLAQAERLDVAQHWNATSTAAWLRSEVPLTPRQAKQAVALAKALDTGTYPATAAALSVGELQPDQAQVIVAAVDALPDLLHAEDRLRGEAHLVELGRTHDAKQLRALGKHLLDVVDPEAAEQEIGKQLEAEEAAAARATSFTLVDDGQGKAHGRFTVSSLHGQMLEKLLQGFANPQAPDAIPRTEEAHGTGGDREGDELAPTMRGRLTCEVMGDALVRLIESYPVDKVPSSGGLNATVTTPLRICRDAPSARPKAGAIGSMGRRDEPSQLCQQRRAARRRRTDNAHECHHSITDPLSAGLHRLRPGLAVEDGRTVNECGGVPTAGMPAAPRRRRGRSPPPVRRTREPSAVSPLR